MNIRPIEIVCHRGANEFAPENTYASSQLCIDWGMDYVEIDVNTSADGVLYLFHGPDLERTTNGTGSIVDQPSAVIDTLDAGSWFDPKFADERIPRLDEFLGWVKGKAKLFIDVKWADLEKLVALIRQHEFEDECFFWFGDPQLATELRQLAPELTLKINADTRAKVEKAVAEFDANIIEAGYPVDPDVVAACKEHGLQLMAYYKGSDEAVFAEIVHQQPDLVNVNFGDRFKQVIDSALNQM